MVENHQAAHPAPALSEAVRYIVRFPNPRSHYIEVEAFLPTAGAAEAAVFLPVWTPGSYLVREYARNVESISVSDLASGALLPFSKIRKNRWHVETRGAPEIHFAYRVYCREMSVRTNWVEHSFALLNGAPAFVGLIGSLRLPHHLQLELPAHWKTSITGLPASPCGAPHSYLADDYDALVDSPVLCGNPALYPFDVDGVPHFLANEGEAGVWDGPRSAADAEQLVRRHRDLWGSLPYRKYVFLNLLTEASGGLEHRNSVCMMTSRWATRTRRAWLNWLNLTSHEFFHVWNIKRLRPVELGPFDYEAENQTRSLWIAEGITDYYAPLTVRRAGLSTVAEYLGSDSPPAPGSLSATIATLQATPGRLVQSVEQASWDAWIKLYRPDENSVNTTISYYTKGAVVGWLLDARIRRAAHDSPRGPKSLDDLMRLAFERFSGDRGFTPAEFKSLASEVAGIPLDDFFRQTVESTEELDYSEALAWFGLRFKPHERSGISAIGAETRLDNGRLLVTRVPRGTPAATSGLTMDDEIIALDDFRVRPDQFAQRLENYRPGDKVSLLIARRDLLSRVDVILADEPRRWQLEIRPDVTSAQMQNLASWLGL